MSLVDRINDELKNAMRAKDQTRLAVIRAVRGEIIKLSKSGGDTSIEDDDVTKLVKSQIKQRQDAIAMFEKGGRDELAAAEKAQIEILLEFLPQQLTEAELDSIVQDAVATTEATTMKDMGKVMKAVKDGIAATGKDADNRVVAGLVKAALSG